MQSAVEIISDLELKISISVPANEFKDAYGKRVQEVAKTAQVTGFRPGKVPLAYIKKFYGSGIETEVIDDIVKKSFDKVCKERELSIAGIEKLNVTQRKLGKNLEFCVDVEVFPEVKFEDKDFTDISLEKYKVDITDKDIAESVDKLRKSHATWETAAANAKAKIGDKVIIDFKGTESDGGKEIESGSAQDFELELGSNYLIPGFEEGIVGHKVSDDSFSLSLKFPDDYHVQEHAGQNVNFEVVLKEIKHAKLPELDQDFFAKFGVTLDSLKEQEQEQDSVDYQEKAELKDDKNSDNSKEKKATDEELKELNIKLEEKVAESLKLEAEKLSTNKYRSALYDSLREHKPISVPKSLIEEEVDKLVENKQNMYRQYTGDKNATLDLNRDSFKSEAEKNVHLMLLVRSFIGQYKITVDNNQLKEKLAQQWGNQNVSDDLLNWYTSDSKRYKQLESQVLEDLVVKNLEDRITVAEKKVSFKNLVEDK